MRSIGIDEFEYACRVPNCRGQVTTDDWRNPELRERYAGYFSPYLQRRIRRPRGKKTRYITRSNI